MNESTSGMQYAGMIGAGLPHNEIRQRPSVQDSLESAEKALATLQDRISTLGARLEPVLGSSYPKDCEKEQAELESCPLISHLNQHRRIIHRAESMVNDILDRLEL